jgi:hypothetical protein
MIKKRLAKGLRKYIRQEKSRFKKEFSEIKERKEKIKELYNQFHSQKKDSSNK